jgi:hypothetical protein
MIDQGPVFLEDAQGFLMLKIASDLLENIEGPLVDLLDLVLLQNLQLSSF